jgi:hypothetical protein
LSIGGNKTLLAAGLMAVALTANAADTAASVSASTEKLRQLMEQVRPQPNAAQAGSPAVLTAKTVSPARLHQRIELLKTGESALARLDVDAALQAFDQAAMILHAADTEIALVRAYMQGGEYRRALAFGAHTAGAHLDVVGGSALYAWLLNAGGQPAIAQRLLAEAQVRSSATRTPVTASDAAAPHAASVVLGEVQQQLNSGTPRASGALLALPTRLAPYGRSEGLPITARVIGSGVLMQSGKEALVPIALVPRSGKLWLRNGLGQLATAQVIQRLSAIGVARLRLGHALPAAQDLWGAERDAFPGSAGYAIEFVAAPDALPAWPVLRTGFLGGMTGLGSQRQLGIDMPQGARGGPVFDAAGHLMGMSLQGKPGTPDLLVAASTLPPDLRTALAGVAPKDAGARASVDKIYEISLKTTLQVIALP